MQGFSTIATQQILGAWPVILTLTSPCCQSEDSHAVFPAQRAWGEGRQNTRQDAWVTSVKYESCECLHPGAEMPPDSHMSLTGSCLA